MKPCLVVYMIQLRFTTWDSDALSISVFAATMSSVMNSVCCALVCVLCVSLVVWTVYVTSGAPEEDGDGDHKQRRRGAESGVVCAINSSLDIHQVEKNEDKMDSIIKSCLHPFSKVSLALEKGNQELDSQHRHQHVQTMHHFTAGKIRFGSLSLSFH